MSTNDPIKPQDETTEEKANLSDEAKQRSSTGLEPNVAALLSYIVGFITGIVFYLLEKENKFVRFHALQSIFLTATYLILDYVFDYLWIFGFFLNILLYPAFIVLWIICLVKAYQGQKFKIPILGDLAEKYK